MSTRFTFSQQLLAAAILAAILGIAAVAALQGRAAGQQRLAAADAANAELALVLTNAVRQQFVKDLPGDRFSFEAAADTDYARLEAAIRALAAGTRLQALRIDSPDGVTIFATDPAENGAIRLDEPGFAAALAEGPDGAAQATSRIAMRAAEGGPVQGVLVLTAGLPADAAGRLPVPAAATLLAAALIGLLALALRQGGRRLAAERRRAEAAAAECARAAAVSDAKSRFLANLSHELRTPLNAVIGFAELLRGALSRRQPVQRGHAENIHAAGLELLGVIENVLDLVSAEHSQIPVDSGRVDLPGLAQPMVQALQARAAAGLLQLRLECDGPLPPLTADARKVEQILRNLLDNALKFTPPNGSILVRIEDGGASQRIVVADTGVGIAPAVVETCLAPFGQAAGAGSRVFRGAGLGLPIAKLFAEAMGGTLQLRSEPDRGTVVTVTLPVAEASAEVLAEAA